jgi:hypothetical protein
MVWSPTVVPVAGNAEGLRRIGRYLGGRVRREFATGMVVQFLEGLLGGVGDGKTSVLTTVDLESSN